MNKHVEKAKQLREAQPMEHNCTQAILCAYAQEIGMNEEMAATLGCHFGRGMRCGETCGVITGGLMVLGALGLSHPETASKFRNAIAKNHDGMTDCVDLLRANADSGISNREHCNQMIYEGIERIDEILKEYVEAEENDCNRF